MNPNNPLDRHSGEGRNPAKKNALRSRQNHDIVPLALGIFNPLDSGIRRNDEARVAIAGCNKPVLSAAEGRSALHHNVRRNARWLLRPTTTAALLFLGLIAATSANAEELGRLFFTPEQRAQLDRSHAQKLRPDNNDRGRLILNGIVQRHGGERTIWINGVPKPAGKSDERSPESASIAIPGQPKQTRVKVGQKVIVKPGASEQ